MKRLILILVLLGAAGGGAYYWWHHRPATAEQASFGAGGGRRRGGADSAPIPVVATKAESSDVPIYLDGLGTVEAYNEAQIRAMIDGPLVEVDFTEGQNVKKGDVLARIDPRPYQASLDSAVAKKQQDQANLQNAKLDAARYAKLAATAYSSAQQSDTARAQVAQLEAQVRGDQAQIDTAQTQLSYTTIKAPFDGRVGLRQIDVGNIVHTSDTTPITVLTQLQPISVVFTLPQQSLPAVAAAMQHGAPQVLAVQGNGSGLAAASAGNPAAASGGSKVLDRGKLAVLDNQVDSATGTIKLKATFPNPGLTLWPGGFVNVRLLVNTEHGVTTVPSAAVQRGPNGAYVFVINPDKSVKRKQVTVGHEDERTTVIQAGLQPGDLVVTDGAQRLNDTSKVAIAGPDDNAPAAVPRDRAAPGTARAGGRRAS